MKLDDFERKYLSKWNPDEPFFWRLRISYAAFVELEEAIASCGDIQSHPVAALCYLAEWYKWRYAPGAGGSTRLFNPTGDEIKQMLEAAGIDADKWVARNADTGRHSWLYSVFVLGGLPVAHELTRKEDSRFLRRLCRMFHGENIADGLDGSGRAEAFRKSLMPGGSLAGFIRDTVSGNLPFADEDLNYTNSLASQLVHRIVEANNEVLRDKFRLEWRISAPQSAEYFSRKICMNLLPEVTGAGLHQYLMYDRVKMWGFQNPAEIRWLEFGLRFSRQGEDVDTTSPFFQYTNTYDIYQGFLSVGVDRCVVLRDVPVEPFDTIEVYALADNGEQHTAQQFGVDGCMQLYATDIPGEWTDDFRTQKPTAVLWRLPWRNAAPIEEGLDSVRRFRSRKHGAGSNDWHLTLVPESLTLLNPKDEEITFYDHQGTDTLVARRHDNTVRYRQGDKVCLIEFDDEGLEVETLLPLLMTRHDVAVRRISTDEFGETVEEAVEPETVEWKHGTRFVEWNDDCQPAAGKVKVRATVRGRQLIKDFAFIGGEIVRDLKNQDIYTNDLSFPQHCESHMWYPHALEPTTQVNIANVTIDVWRPVKCIEVNHGDRCLKRTEEDTVTVPALTAAELTVAIFNEDGYRAYHCSHLLAVHSQKSVSDRVAMLVNGNEIPSLTVDPLAPKQLKLAMAFRADKDCKAKWLLWDYLPGHAPVEAPYDTQMGKNMVLFQNRNGEESNAMMVYVPRRTFFPFGLKSLLANASRLECFKTAAHYGCYYFLFIPLEKMTRDEFEKEIYRPLLDEHNGILPSKIKNVLTRAALELGFVTINDL